VRRLHDATAVKIGVAILIGLAPLVAAADPWRTSIDVVLRKKPGEHEPAVATLRAGTVVTVEAQDGRWLRVRAGDRVGYLTRTTVVDAGARASSGARGTWSADGKDVTQLATVTAAAPAPRPPEREAVPAPGALRATAALAYCSLGMDFTSDRAAGIANYLIAAEALAAELSGDATARLGERLRAGGDARVLVATSAPGPGISYTGPSAPSGDIPFSTVGADAGARVGMARGAFALALRAGFHYDAFLPRELANAGRLPREQLVGATLGARVDVAPPGSRFDVALRFDALAFGRRSQTTGLEDGTASRAGALWGRATIRYRLSERLSLVSGIELARATTHWTGASMRAAGVMRADRVDTVQLVQIGVSAER